jgi:type VI secretion system protein ImpK
MTSAPNLASCYQEIFTVVARLRSRKFSLGDSAVFRTEIRKALQQAESASQALGYPQQDIQLASFATIALLDETILNSSNPAFRDWAQKPLMLDLYGTLTAGEAFFEQLRATMKRSESKFAADVLEIYALCLALGFRGRYSAGSEEQLRYFRDPIAERILRTRGHGEPVELSSTWMPEANIDVPAPSNRLTRLALSAFVAIFFVCVLLWAGYDLMLNHGAGSFAEAVRTTQQ